jgi:hypothetical protein
MDTNEATRFTAKNGKTYETTDRTPWEANGRMVTMVRLVKDGCPTAYTRNMAVAEIEQAISN